MAGSNTLTDQIKDWFERTPRAQRAVKRLSADLDIVAEHVEQAASGLLEKVGPIIDPPVRIAPPEETGASATTTANAASVVTAETEPVPTDANVETASVTPESESSVPPGVKKDGEPVDPTT